MSTPSLQHMAMISTLHISMIGINAKDKSATDQANDLFNTTNSAGYYSKCKVNRDDVRPILHQAQAARNYRRDKTRPWGQNDTRLLPSCDVIEFTEHMGFLKHQFVTEVNNLQQRWNSVVYDQQVRLGSLFDPDDYPSQHELLSCFGFSHELLPIPDGSHIVLNIEKQVVEKLKRSLERQNQKRLERSMTDMWKRLYEPVAKMAHVCGQDRPVYKSMIANLEFAVDTLQRLNITGNQEFDDMLSGVRQMLIGWTPEQVRKNKVLKHNLGIEAEKLSAKIDHIMTTKATA